MNSKTTGIIIMIVGVLICICTTAYWLPQIERLETFYSISDARTNPRWYDYQTISEATEKCEEYEEEIKEGYTLIIGSGVLMLICFIGGAIVISNSSRETTKVMVENDSVPDQIRSLAKLRDDGIISAEEFDIKKAELLTKMK